MLNLFGEQIKFILKYILIAILTMTYQEANKKVKENYKQFKLSIKTYVKEDIIKEKLDNGMQEFLDFKNEKNQHKVKKEDAENLNTL